MRSFSVFIAILACTISCGLLIPLCANAESILAFDHSGNLFVAAPNSNAIVKFARDGTKSTFATGVEGALAFDAAGNLFVGVSDATGTIFKFAPDGTKSTFAAEVGNPSSLAFDTNGNLFVFDLNDGSIFKFAPNGNKSLFAEGKKPPGQMFANDMVLACDRAGNLFAGDVERKTIFKFAPDGTKNTFATGIRADALAFDSKGNLIAADFFTNDKLLKFAPDGSRRILKVQLIAPEGLAFDSADNLFVYEGPVTISKFTATGARSSFAQNQPEPAPAETLKSDEEQEAAGEDSSQGLSQDYAKNYLVARSTVSPDKKFAVIYPTLEAEEAADEANYAERIKNYIVALQPFAVIKALDTKWPYFQNESHGGLTAEWSGDSSLALITLDAKWGPRDVFLVEFRDGKLSRMTNIARKVHDLLLPNYRKAKAGRYNDIFDFVFVEDTSFKLEGTSRVTIDASAETSPNIMSEDLGSSDRAWRGHVEAVWDIAQAKFISQKVSGGIRKRTKGASH